ncbi:PAS domain-containing protein [Roseomonas sp. BN140053]|uniref:PAS domain-containing protein n=1 Tax=Roseomonas sp. BN140053 TaxID=3391898 RepID=UPI0039ECC4A8
MHTEKPDAVSRLEAELEQARVEAEDARDEAAALQLERDAAVNQWRQAQDALHRAELRAQQLAAQLASTEMQLHQQRSLDATTAEELRVAFEELRANSEEIEEANDALVRANTSLEERVAERTAALALETARLRTATDALPNLVWVSRDGGDWSWANRRWVDYTGQPEPDTHGLGWLDAIHPEDRENTMAAWAAALERRELRVEHRIRGADGRWRWFVTHALPVVLPEPAFEREEWFGACTEVDEARRTVAALRDSEARLRGFAEATPDVLWIIDARSGRLDYLSPAFERIWGEPPERVMRDLSRWYDMLHPEDRDRAAAALKSVLSGQRREVEYRIRRAPDGAVRWIRDTGFPVLDSEGRVHLAAGVARDITERRQAEEQQRLLMRELDHRVKNALAVAQALAAQTARSNPAPAAFVDAFSDRLRAFGHAQDLLTREGWRGASLADLVAITLKPYDGKADRVRAEGPPLRLPPATVTALHLALHELATNAVKYGALSAPQGRVEVRWNRAGDRLRILWSEQGGPPVSGPPTRHGFGLRLLQRAIPRQLGGTVLLDYHPAGVQCRMEFPFPTAPDAGPDPSRL